MSRYQKYELLGFVFFGLGFPAFVLSPALNLFSLTMFIASVLGLVAFLYGLDHSDQFELIFGFDPHKEESFKLLGFEKQEAVDRILVALATTYDFCYKERRTLLFERCFRRSIKEEEKLLIAEKRVEVTRRAFSRAYNLAKEVRGISMRARYTDYLPNDFGRKSRFGGDFGTPENFSVTTQS